MNARELDVLNILAGKEEAQTATNIVDEMKGLTQSTVISVLRKLLRDNQVEVVGVAHSGKVLSRTYAITGAGRNAVVDPFEALLSVCRNYEIYQDDIKRLREKAKVYADEANKEFNRMCRNKTFREMELNYRLNMLPTCPECSNSFDPVKITSWTNRKILEVYGKDV